MRLFAQPAHFQLEVILLAEQQQIKQRVHLPPNLLGTSSIEQPPAPAPVHPPCPALTALLAPGWLWDKKVDVYDIPTIFCPPPATSALAALHLLSFSKPSQHNVHI